MLIQGCAQGVGFCASVHTDLVLTKLENVAKWEHQKKAGGILGFIKDSMPARGGDGEGSSVRAAILLSYGYLLYYCPVDTVAQRLESTVLRFLKLYLEKPKVGLPSSTCPPVPLAAAAGAGGGGDGGAPGDDGAHRQDRPPRPPQGRLHLPAAGPPHGLRQGATASCLLSKATESHTRALRST